MDVTLQARQPKQRFVTYAAWATLVASPFLLLLLLSVWIGHSAFQNTPLWTDELDYWRALYSWLGAGASAGYSGIGELTAPVGVLSVHGLSPLLLYLLPARLFGWARSSIVVYNCLWVSLGATVFCALNRPKPRVAFGLAAGLMVYAPVILYAATSMTELANYGLLLLYAAFLWRSHTVRQTPPQNPAKPRRARGFVSMLLCAATILFCCAYRISYIGLWIPLALVATEGRVSWRTLGWLASGVVLSGLLYAVTTRYASPFTSGFLYNLLRTGSLGLSVRMFLSHAKSNLIDFFFSTPANPMETAQRVLYCAMTLLALIGSFVSVQRQHQRFTFHFAVDRSSLLGFCMLFLPFVIVVLAYETNDWSDYRTLAPFAWLVFMGALVRGRRVLSAAYLLACTAVLGLLLSIPPVGALSEDARFSVPPKSAGVTELCQAITYDAEATDPFTNTVRCDMFTFETVSQLHPGIGIQTGWFTPETVGKSRWILTDHLKIPVQEYELLLRIGIGNVYKQIDAAAQE